MRRMHDGEDNDNNDKEIHENSAQHKKHLLPQVYKPVDCLPLLIL